MENNLKSSSDIWFVAFLMLKNEKINNYTTIGRGKVKCFFDLSDETWQKYKLEFNNSDYIKFKGLVEQVKDLSF